MKIMKMQESVDVFNKVLEQNKYIDIYLYFPGLQLFVALGFS